MAAISFPLSHKATIARWWAMKAHQSGSLFRTVGVEVGVVVVGGVRAY